LKAYKPVAALNGPRGAAFIADVPNLPDKSLTVQGDTALFSTLVNTSTWWQWWFIFMGYPNKGTSKEDEYEKMGDRAFAGGSHGEVWRGKRKCSRKERYCDETKKLVLKRLKVELGTDLLEAGLREIYFGHILMGEDDMFSVYVDHFFRESTSAFTRTRQELELWIVYEDAGPSLGSYLYQPMTTGGFVVYQHSLFWTKLRQSTSSETKVKRTEDKSLSVTRRESKNKNQFGKGMKKLNAAVGRTLMREVLRQLLKAASYLHGQGIVHRDIKPSNYLCSTKLDLAGLLESDAEGVDISEIKCVLADFSSAWDNFSNQNLYSHGPTAAEQTSEYAPPEALLGPTWIPFLETKPETYDSWSVGVVALELLLGTPNVFSVDQRTTAVLSNKMKKRGASEEEIQRALYLAALSQFCIYIPQSGGWPMGETHPLFNAAMVKQSCTIKDFHHALRARDPLGLGFDSTSDALLHLIWNLLAWDPRERMTATEALRHPYFTTIDLEQSHASSIASLMLDPRMDTRLTDTITEFRCPKCNRKFDDWRSCQKHAITRQHAKFCTYDRSQLPTCLNAHTLLPAHPFSGYCDIQGRRRTIEDFHSIHLHSAHQFYGVFDGHTGNLAAKFAASTFYELIHDRLSALKLSSSQHDWKKMAEIALVQVFDEIHVNFLSAASTAPSVMDQSGTTATVLYVNDDIIVVANVGDSRAVLSSWDDGVFRAIPLTIDHVASDPAELNLVKNRGGEITSNGGIDRVNGTLAITRSIGDAALAPLLSRIPHVNVASRKDLKEACGDFSGNSAPCFIVLASDGLWDVLSNQEAIDMVAEVLNSFTLWQETNAFQEAAQRLTHEAYVRGSTDNIGVCVVALE
jgi:serine/threonine protein phosphatase PrpC/serine/threonine protein kinase